MLLGLAKLVGGMLGESFALISDAVNSLGDVFTSVAVLLAFRVAQKPADAEHPYGHTRAEAIAGSNVAVLVIVSALLVGWECNSGVIRTSARGSARLDAGDRRSQRGDQGGSLPVQDPAGPPRRLAAPIIANAWDHRADAFSALAVLVGLFDRPPWRTAGSWPSTRSRPCSSWP